MNYNPLRQPAPILLGGGAAIGLVIGLLIGWVFWPVEWSGATLHDLYPQEKAEYIAAVADAYVIYDNLEARAIAQRRLAQLDDGNLQQNFEEALQYFRDSQFSDKAIRDSNIRRLAVALSLAPPAAEVAAQPTSEAVADTPTTAAIATPISAAETSAGLGWIGWLLWLLTALLLLAGGIYLLSKAGLPDFSSLLKPRPKPADEIDEFDEPSAPQQAATPSSGHELGRDYSFDQEDDERPRRSLQPSPADDERNRRSTTNIYHVDEFSDRRAEANRYADDRFEDDHFENDEYDDADFGDDPFEDENEEGDQWQSARERYSLDVSQDEDAPPMTRPTAYAAPPSATPYSQPSEVDQEAELNNGDDQAKTAFRHATPAKRSQSAPRSIAVSDGRPTPPQTRYRVIDQHIFHYQSGMTEYDESRPIVDPQSSKYIGEFGMGASSKNALAQTEPDQLVALEVWLFDKSDERQLGNYTRILLSEYAVDHKLEGMFLKERQDNPRPFTAQPGVHFQLESQNLLLDCTIVEVEYSTGNDTQGIFQEITVDMTVQKKGGR